MPQPLRKVLPAPSTPPPSSGTVRLPAAGQRVILVSAPTAAPGYDSSRMVYTRDAGSLEAFTHSVWVDTPARMLEPLVARALQDSGTFRAVVAAPSSTRADLRLDCSIERLQQNYLQHPSQARLQLRVTLLDNNSREVLAWQVFDMSQAATTEDAAGAAAATRAVVQKATQALALWLKDY
jgi:cholesterol transport system auxiliary component